MRESAWPALFFAAGRADFNAEARRRGEAETFQPCRTCRACREALRGTTEAGKAMNRLAAIVAESLSVPASKLAPGKRTPRHPFGFPGLAGHGSGLRPTRNFTEVSHLRFEVKSRGTYQATFRGASVSREAGFRVGWRRCLHRQGGAMGGCVLARESAHGPPGAGEARRRHPFQWSREALPTFASSAPLRLCVESSPAPFADLANFA